MCISNEIGSFVVTGFLYRFRDMHSRAASVLKEAVDLQEAVLGATHGTVLSTLDNLADSCANSGAASDSLKYYGLILERFRTQNKTNKGIRAEAVLLYKMSRVHRQRSDREAQIHTLQEALKAVQAYQQSVGDEANGEMDPLERHILYEIRLCREDQEKQ